MAETVASLLRGGPGETVSVLLPIPLAGAYDYRVPAGMFVEEGQYVRVPLGARVVSGVVWGSGSGDVAAKKIRPIGAVLNLPPMKSELQGLIDWVAHYYLASAGAVLRMAMSVPTALQPPKPLKLYIDTGSRPPRMTPQRARVFAVLADGVPRLAAVLSRLASVTPDVVRGL